MIKMMIFTVSLFLMILKMEIWLYFTKILTTPEIAAVSMFKAEKFHCVWMMDGVYKVRVLYESGDFPEPDHLGVTID